MEWFPVFLLALAVSIDSFSVGLTYGLKKVRIPPHAIIIIAICSGFALYLASLLGFYISVFLSPQVAHSIGGAILISLGVWIIIQFFRTSKDRNTAPIEKEEKVLIKFEIKSIGLVIQILKKPMAADLDRSGTITGFEAVLLGTALSLDAAGAGIGASMLGFSPILLAVFVGVMSGFFAFFGIKTGSIASQLQWVKRFSILPGLLLIFLGIWKL